MPSVPQAVIATISANGARSASAVRRRSVPLHAACFLSGPIDVDAKHGCKHAANHRARAALEPGRGDRLGHRVRPQRRSGRPAAAAAAGAARHRRDAERAERRRDVHRRASSVRCWRRASCSASASATSCWSCFGLDIVLFLAMKPFDSLAAWFVLRAALGAWSAPPSSRPARPGSTSSPAMPAAAASSGSMPPRCRPDSASVR